VLSPDIAPILGRSGAGVAALLVDPAPPVVVPAPSVVVEQAAVEVTPPSTLERSELPPVPVASSVAGVAPQAEGPVSPVEVATTTLRQEQPDTAMVVSKGAAESTLPEAQAEVTVTAISPAPLDVATVASEEVVQSAPPVA